MLTNGLCFSVTYRWNIDRTPVNININEHTI